MYLPLWLVSGPSGNQGANLGLLLQSPFVMPAKSLTLGARRFTAGKSALSAEFKAFRSNLPTVLRLRLGANDKFELGAPCYVIKFKFNASANSRRFAKFDRKLPPCQISAILRRGPSTQKARPDHNRRRDLAPKAQRNQPSCPHFVTPAPR